MASFSLNEGNKGIGLRSLGKVDNLHNAPRTGPQQMVAVSLGHPMVPICAHPGPVVSPKLASGLVLPDKLVHLPFMGPFSRSIFPLGLFPVLGYYEAAMIITIQLFLWTHTFISFR